MKTLDQVLRDARADGVTMIILDVNRQSCWHGRQRKNFYAYDPDPVAGLRAVLEKAMAQDPEILV